jgi:hypothetical protein
MCVTASIHQFNFRIEGHSTEENIKFEAAAMENTRGEDNDEEGGSGFESPWHKGLKACVGCHTNAEKLTKKRYLRMCTVSD